jgi:hypothetical protein
MFETHVIASWTAPRAVIGWPIIVAIGHGGAVISVSRRRVRPLAIAASSAAARPSAKPRGWFSAAGGRYS